MVRSCCICQKEYGMEENVTFHRIPTKQDLRLKWFTAIGKEVSKYASVCDKHFDNDGIIYTSMIKGTVRRRLCSEAVPTLHLKRELLKCDSTIIENKNLNSQYLTQYDKTNIDSITVRQVCMDKKDHKQKSINPEGHKQNSINSNDDPICEISEIEKLSEKINIAKKRNIETEEENNKKRCHVPRYAGDFCREDFASDRNWQIFCKYYKETSRKLKVLQETVRRRTKKIETLRDLVNNLKDNKLISDEIATIILTASKNLK
ncbi:THAP domain-containing protein 1-like [Cataglyphis hispanica]|uniref:THAP domain-containing protein 1-like n=1 Tax=Cataglyphis hispanica TaxID=1086592 RepID=UPI002180895D|nr:THAP domain-containing protein 1-like [Cataglyphis hispanica]